MSNKYICHPALESLMNVFHSLTWLRLRPPTSPRHHTNPDPTARQQKDTVEDIITNINKVHDEESQSELNYTLFSVFVFCMHIFHSLFASCANSETELR